MPKGRGSSCSRIVLGNHLIFVDILNVASCFAVVALHVSLSVFTPERTSDWLTDVWFQACSIFAVPVFFMISGANLLGYRERYSTKEFFFKRLRRVGLALLCGSALCYIIFCRWPMGFYAAESYASGVSLLDFAKRFMTNQINDIYWFLYKIIFLYLVTPLFSLALGNKRLMHYLVCLALVAGIGFPFARFMGIDSKVFSTSLAWPLFSDVSVFYYLLGGYIARYYKETERNVIPHLLVFVGATILMGIWGLVSNGFFADVLADSYLNYPIGTASPLCALQAVSLYLLLNDLEPRLQRMPRAARWATSRLSGASLTVYLIHILFINALPVGKAEWFVNRIHSNKLGELLSVYLLSALVGIVWVAVKKLVRKSFVLLSRAA